MPQLRAPGDRLGRLPLPGHAIAGDPAATDPACVKSPIHHRMGMLIDDALQTGKAEHAAGKEPSETFVYRRIAAATQPA